MMWSVMRMKASTSNMRYEYRGKSLPAERRWSPPNRQICSIQNVALSTGLWTWLRKILDAFVMRSLYDLSCNTLLILSSSWSVVKSCKFIDNPSNLVMAWHTWSFTVIPLQICQFIVIVAVLSSRHSFAVSLITREPAWYIISVVSVSLSVYLSVRR